MDATVEKLAKAVSLIRKSLTCSVCLEVCSNPYTTRCGHPFCYQCIATVMVKRGAQCPMCKGSLSRRTVHRNPSFLNVITRFHKIEDAIKADIHIDIAAYQVHPQSKEATGEDVKNLFPKTYLPAPGSSKRNKVMPRISSEIKLDSTNNLLKYRNLKQQPQSSSNINPTHKVLENRTESPDSTSSKKIMDAPLESISKNSDTCFSKNTSIQETPKTKLREKIKPAQTIKTRKRPKKFRSGQTLTFRQVHQRLRDREKSVASTSVDTEKKAKDSFCEPETEKIMYVKASTEVAKKTWSRVKKFGKEMRPLKKKSLNVSIESKSHNTPNSTSKKILSTEMVDSQDIFATAVEKYPSNVGHSFSKEKKEEDLISRLSCKEVNDINGVVPEEDSETCGFTPQNINDNQSPEKCGSMMEYFKGFQNASFKAERILIDKTPPKDAKSTPEQIIEDSNPEDERNGNLLSSNQSQKRETQCSDDTKSYKSSPEVPKMTLTTVEISSTNEFRAEHIDLTLPLEQMDFTLPVSSVQLDRKKDKRNYLGEENNPSIKDVEVVSQCSSQNKDPKFAAKEVLNLLSKRIHDENVKSYSVEKNAKCCKLSLTKLPQVDMKYSEVAKTFVPFKKLGRIFLKKQRRIPFYYLSRLSNNHNFVEKSNVTMLSPTKWRKKHLKGNFSITNLSDSGFSRTRGNITPKNLKVNNSMQGLQRTCSGAVVLLSPQNDSQLKHLSIGSPHKEGELSVLQTSIVSSTDNLNCSSSTLERQKSFKTSKARKNIVEKFEPLAKECEELGKKEELIAKNEVLHPDYKKIFLDAPDFDIDTAKFNEFADEIELIPKKPYEEEELEKRKQEEPKLVPDTDSGSVIPSSLDRPPKKLKLTYENLTKPAFFRSPNSTESLQRRFEYPRISQRNSYSMQNVEFQDISDHFFEDVIEKSKCIRANTSVNNIEVNIEPNPKEMKTTEHLEVNFFKTKTSNMDKKVEKLSNCIKNIETLNEPESATELIEENVEEMQIDPSFVFDSLHISVHCQNEETQNSGSDKENTMQNSNEVESSQLSTHNVKPAQTLFTSFVRNGENLETNVRNSEDVTEVCKSPALETSYATRKKNRNEEMLNASKSKIIAIPPDIRDTKDAIEACKTPALETSYTTNKKNRNEEILNVSRSKIIGTPPDSLMNITEEQLMLNEFEKELFGEANKAREDDMSLLPDGLKTPNTSTVRVADIDSRSDNKLFAETLHDDSDDDDVDIIENTPKDKQNILAKMLLDKDCSDFSPIPLVGSSQSEIIRPFIQPAVKRKSCPLYHSTPKVPRTASPRCATSLNSDTLLSSLQNPGPSYQEKIKEDSVMAIPKLTFVCSGLPASQIDTVKQLAKLVKADFTSSFNPNVTHVIVKATGPQNAAEKTLKYVQGIAHRKWIVSVKWALDSLQESKLLNEENYEAVDNLTLEEGPKKSRLRKKGIFENFLCMCKGPFNNVSVEEYWDLLTHTGATLVHTMDDLTDEKKKLKILVVQGDQWDDETIKEWFQKTKAVPVAHEWIVECISQYKLVSLLDYLQAIMPQDVSAVGFPEDLLLDEESDCEYED